MCVKTLLVLLVLVFVDCHPGHGYYETQAPVNYKGFCAYPCHHQERTYFPFTNNDGDLGTRSKSDPTVATIRNSDGVIEIVLECYARVGPFTIERAEIAGDTTHAKYRCTKEVPTYKDGDFLFVYKGNWMILPDYPSVCEVCNGELYQDQLRVYADEKYIDRDIDEEKILRKAEELGCNLPQVCPVTNDNQTQCVCTRSYTFDDGFCCPEKNKHYQ